MITRRALAMWILAVLVAGSIAQAQDPATQPAASARAKLRIVLAGDSTVAKEHGWGNGFTACMSDQVQVVNLGHNGASSKSFTDKGDWQKCLAQKPDYILIQFGHNDQKLTDPTRGTDPETTYRERITRMIDEAQAAGIKPILVTSLSRRLWGSDGKIHSNLLPYVNVVKDIAAKKNVPLIDLHALSIQLYESLGKSAVNDLSPIEPSTKPADAAAQPPKVLYDGTHLNDKGSVVIGKLMAEQLAKVLPDVAPYIKTQ